ncbi:hypothetical protein ACTMU2_19570 [Cupriavidus basilensis]
MEIDIDTYPRRFGGHVAASPGPGADPDASHCEWPAPGRRTAADRG